MERNLIPLTEAHQKMLEDRGVPAETAHRLGWQTCGNRKGDWIAIPFLRAGKVVNHKYRRINKLPDADNFGQDKGGEQCFYNLAALEDIATMRAGDGRAQEVIITEGELDCAVALHCGYLAVSVPGGAPDKPVESEDSVKYDFLKDFPKFVTAVLAVDDDPPGHVMRQDMALRLGWHRCKWIQYPKGCKDLSDVYKKYGRKGVDVVLQEKSKFMNQGGLFRMSDLPAQPEIPALECGIGNVSSMVKLRPGDTVVVTGIPSMGKTTFVNCLASNMAMDHGWNICVGSFEQSPRGDHQRYLRTYYLGKSEISTFGNRQWSPAEMAEADAWIDRYFAFIVPDVDTDDMVTLKWVLARVRAAITQYGSRLIVIDPWNELDHDRPQGMSLTEYTGFAIKEFKRLAKQYMVTVIIVAHPAKMEKNREGGYSVPTLYDISDSSHWANKSDIGIVIHRLEGEGEGNYATLVRVAKIRFWGVIGRTGDRLLEYNPSTGKYIDSPDFQPKKKRDITKATPEKEPTKKAGESAQASLPIDD